MQKLAVVSMHTSPLALPGSGDSGGMNVYVRELASALAQAGVHCDVYVRRWREDLPDIVEVEQGFRVQHVDAGPPSLSKAELVEVVEEFREAVLARMQGSGDVGAIHANYWLSGVAAHDLKHELDLPLVSTFHTLARVKAHTGDPEPERRDRAEVTVMGCSDVILASCTAEADQLDRLYEVPRERIEVVAPGVDHAFFSPGDRQGARRALGLGDHPLLLFVGRIQPLKGLRVAIAALAEMHRTDAHLLVVGGPSGDEGASELAAAVDLVSELGLQRRVHFVDPQPHHVLSTFYRAADVCVVPSRSESFGLVALEAAACGIPVVAAAVGGLTTIVEHGSTGLLIEERDPSAYACALDALLDDGGWAADLGAQGARRARDYRWSTAAARLRRIYSDLGARALIRC